MKWWQYILGFCVAVLVIGSLVGGILVDKQRFRDYKADFYSQCKMDGYKQTDCHYKWRMMRQ